MSICLQDLALLLEQLDGGDEFAVRGSADPPKFGFKSFIITQTVQRNVSNVRGQRT